MVFVANVKILAFEQLLEIWENLMHYCKFESFTIVKNFSDEIEGVFTYKIFIYSQIRLEGVFTDTIFRERRKERESRYFDVL